MQRSPVTVKLIPSGQLNRQPNAPRRQSRFLSVGYDQEQTLAQAVYLSGLLASPALCSGLAVCGRCRMRIIQTPCPLPSLPVEHDFFSPEEIACGWRLACRHKPFPGLLTELPAEAQLLPDDLTDARAPHEGLSRSFQASCLAVDFGTTSMQWQALAPYLADSAMAEDSPHGLTSLRVVHQGKMLNPQMGAGSDVIARLAVAQKANGARRLRDLSLAALRFVVRNATRSAPVQALCLAANPAMTAIILGLDTTGLAHAPYVLPLAGGYWTDLPGLPRTWVPPQLSPFVGGDIAAGYVSIAAAALLKGEKGKASSALPAMRQPAYPFLLADMGTNGEFLLALSPDSALTASVALGPALEGIGLSHGTEARQLAVTDFSFEPQGIIAFVPCADGAVPDEPGLRPVSNTTEPAGISGTGYLALLHILLRCGAMNSDGIFTPDAGKLQRRFFPFQTDARGQAFLPLPNSLRLYTSDVEAILKVKAAFSLGLRRLLAFAGIRSEQLAAVYLAGSLGRHVRVNALEDLGFLPPGIQPRTYAVGNSSLAGAGLLLKSKKLRVAACEWAARVQSVDLARDTGFMRDYVESMRFVW